MNTNIKKVLITGMSLLCAYMVSTSTALASKAEYFMSNVNSNSFDVSQLSKEELFNYYMEAGEVPPLFDDGDDICTNAVIGDDERTKVENTNIAPYKYIGKLYVVGTLSTCSAFAKNAVLTSAHCVFDKATNQLKEFKKIKFGLNNDTSYKVITTQPTEIIVCPDYINGDHSSENDWAIIYFNDNILSGCLGFSTGASVDDTITVTGYPGEVETLNSTGEEQYTCSGKVLESDTGKIGYDADTSSGQSGSPVYNKKTIL